jgi:hypothetical protein
LVLNSSSDSAASAPRAGRPRRRRSCRPCTPRESGHRGLCTNLACSTVGCMHILPLGRRHRAQNLANDIPYRVAQRVRTRTPCRFHCCCRVCSLSAPCVWRLATRRSQRSPPLLAARIPESRPSAVDDRRRRRPRPRSPAAHASPQPLHAQPQPCVRQHPRAHAQERLRHVPHSVQTCRIVCTRAIEHAEKYWRKTTKS